MIDANVCAFMAFLHTYFDYCKTWAEFWWCFLWTKTVTRIVVVLESIALSRRLHRQYKFESINLWRIKSMVKMWSEMPEGTLQKVYDAWIRPPIIQTTDSFQTTDDKVTLQNIEYSAKTVFSKHDSPMKRTKSMFPRRFHGILLRFLLTVMC